MKKYINLFLTGALSLILLGCGCNSLLSKNEGVSGKAGKQEEKAKSKIEVISKELTNSDKEKLKYIGQYSFGINYALKSATNMESQVALELNLRNISLSTQPTVEEIQEMQIIVNVLSSNYNAGIKLLKAKDKEIINLQNDIQDLNKDKEEALNNYYKLADKTAALEDSHFATLRTADSYFGLGAIYLGLKRFFSTSILFIVIGLVLFLILRLAASMSPVASSIMAIFEHMVSWVINGIRVVFPKALSMAGTVSKEVYNASHTLLVKMTDQIQFLKELSKKDPNKKYTIDELLTEFSKVMNDEDKAKIDQIKKELGYVK